MSNHTINLTEDLYQYLLQVGVREPDCLAKLREETLNHPQAIMQIAPEQGQFMVMMAQLLGVKRYLEVGVFTGYSALAVALALPDDGCVIACDVNAEFTAIAERHWQLAGLDNKIDLQLRPALETLQDLLDDGQQDSIDMAFIDADKVNYDGYYEMSLQLLRPGGLMLVDNVLWSGAVADESISDPDTAALRALNRKIHQDSRVDAILLPLADGLTMVRKRS